MIAILILIVIAMNCNSHQDMELPSAESYTCLEREQQYGLHSHVDCDLWVDLDMCIHTCLWKQTSYIL